MASELTRSDVEKFLQELGKRYFEPAVLYLVGGGALLLMDNPRRTLDLDYVGHDMPIRWTELQRVIDALGNELGYKIEAVPLDEMIPLPSDSARRHLPFGTYGSVQVYIFDPYAIALSKLDRGNESDLQDIVFLIQRDYVEFEELEQMLTSAIPRAGEYDLNPKQMTKNLETVRQMLKP